MTAAGASLAAAAGASLVAAAYLRAAVRLARRTPGRVGARRACAFVIGLAAAWLAWSAPLARLTHVLLTAHMVQHLLLVLVAAPLLLLGAPVLVFAGGARGAIPAWARRAGRRLTHPLVAGSSMVIVTLGWHLPGAFALSMRSPLWHAAANLTFLGSGLLFWWPVVLPWPSEPQWPRWAVPLYLIGFDMPVSVLSAYLAFCGHVVYPAYLAAPRSFGVSALDDQVAAAMVMWMAMLVAFAGTAVVVIVRSLERTT